MCDCTKEDEDKIELWDLLTVGRILGMLHDGYDECHFTSEKLREVSSFLYAEYTAVWKMWEEIRGWADRRLAEELGRAMREAFSDKGDVV